MSRPKPTVLLELTNKVSYKTDQVLASDGIWAIFYENRPINLKSSHSLTNDVSPHYRKTSFSNQGHAINLARKLNTQFKTDKFTVVLMNSGTTIYEHPGKSRDH